MPERPTYRDGRVHLCARQCSTCIFRPGNPMHLAAGRVKDLVDDARSGPGGTITCHQTLDGDHAVCRGYYDAHGVRDPILRMAAALDVIVEVDLGGDGDA